MILSSILKIYLEQYELKIRRLIKYIVSKDSILRVKSTYYRVFGGNQIIGRHGNSLKINNAILRNCYIDFHGRNNKVIFRG